MTTYNHHETTDHMLAECNKHMDEALDKGISLKKFILDLNTSYEREAIKRLRTTCARFVELYDEMDTIP